MQLELYIRGKLIETMELNTQHTTVYEQRAAMVANAISYYTHKYRNSIIIHNNDYQVYLITQSKLCNQ